MGTMPGGQHPAERNAGLDAGLAWATANLLMADTTGDTPLTERSTSTNATPLPAIPAQAGIHSPMPDAPHSHRTTPMPEHPDFFEQCILVRVRDGNNGNNCLGELTTTGKLSAIRLLDHRIILSASSWWCYLRHSTPYPEPSTAAGRRLDIRRPASSSDRCESSTARTVAELGHPIRHLRRNLAAVLLGLPLFFGLATEAAQAQVLISNIGQQAYNDTLGNLITDYAQAFTTGSHKQGYTVSGVDMVLQKNDLNDLFRKRNPRLTVTIREESSGIPGTIVGTLNLPASSPTFTSDRTFTFMAPAKGIQLSPSTTYFVVIDIDASRSTNTKAGLRILRSDDENAGGAAGFSIANKPLIWAWYENPPKWENLTGGATSIEMSVKGELNPITDLIQMKNATRRIAEFGAPKDPGDEDSLRVIVDIGDGLSPQGRRRVNYTVSGTALLGTDYKIDGCTSSPCTSIFRANQHSLIIPIDVINDDLDEGDETIVITLQDGTGYTVNKSKRTATVTITDDDTRGLVFYRRWPDVDEGGSETFTVKLRSQPTAPVTVNIASNNQDVTVDTDKTMPGNQNTLSFTPTDWNTAQTVTVSAAQDDDAVDDTATLTYTTSGGDYGGANALSIDRPVSVDDDETRTTTGPQLPRISLTGGAAVTEGGGASFTVNADPAPTARLTVNVEVFDGLSGQDFVAASQEGVRTVTLNAGATSTTFTVLTVDDNTDEDDGAVQVFVNDGTGYNAGQGSVVTVRDNDGPAPPSASFAAESSSVAEDGGTHNVPVNLSQAAPSGGLTLSYNVSGTATAGSGYDFTIQGSGSLTIPAGTTTADIPVVINDDSTDENAETVILTLTSGTGYRLGSTRVHTLTITDNDAPPATPGLVISRSTLRVSEGGTGSYMVSLATEPTGTVTVNIASNNTDVTVSPAPLTFHASGGSSPWNTAQTVTVSAGQDNDATDDSATLTHTASGGGYDSVATASVTVTVDDDETPPLPPVASFTSALSSVAEDEGTHNVTVNLSVVAPSGGLTLRYSVTGTATATAGSGYDFTIQGSGSLTIPAGTTTADIPVVINDDSTDENAETVILTLTSGTGYRLGSTRVHTLTITDNDDPLPDTPGLVIDSVLVPVSEGGTGSYMVSLATEPTGTVTVNIASNNTDVTVSPAPLTFHASGGSSPWNTAQTVTVSAGQDPDADDDSATLTHTASGGGYGNVPEASVTVTVDDDGTTPTPPPTAPTPVVSISAGVPSVTEGDAISFTLSATPPPEAGTTITVTVNVAEGGSVAASGETGGRQVAISTSGMASFIVATDDDAIYEPDGSITATVQAGAGYRPDSSNASAAVSVKDNDPGLELSTGHLRVSKGGSISYTIALATQPSGPVRVSISGHEATGLTVDVASLDFTPDHWDVPQEVTLTAPGKAASITLTHTATGGNYGGVEAEVVVTVIALDPKARQGWLSRFGRTVSHQVVAGIQDRFAAPPSPPGLHLTVAGEEFINATALAENQQVLAKALGFETITAQQLVEGSAFSFAPSADGTPAQFAIWGQGALASFSGAEDSLSLDGDVSTALLGAEWSGARWLAGAALSHSWGNGSYAEDNTVAGGDISSSTLTGIFPYGRYGLTPRLGIWAITGYGWGDLTIEPDGDGTDYSPGTTMVMTAVGIDGLLRDGGAEGLSLTTTADALTVQTTSEAVADLASSDANITRLRLGLEATRPVPLANGASLLPSLELGIRQDRGDAETGFGMELGAGLAWTDPERGISADLKGRTLLTHTDEAFQEQGLAVSFAWEPSPSNRGPSFSVSHAVGATAEGGMDALLSPTAMETLDVTPSRHHQFETKLAYGFPAFNDRLTITPGLGWALSPDSRTYSLLWALAPYTQQSQAEPWEISLEGERQEDNAADSSVEHSLKLRFSLPF